MGVSGQFHALAALPREEPLYSLNSRVGGPKAGLGGFEEKKISYPSRPSNPGPSRPQLVSQEEHILKTRQTTDIRRFFKFLAGGDLLNKTVYFW
jgi:hypothetical protein